MDQQSRCKPTPKLPKKSQKYNAAEVCPAAAGFCSLENPIQNFLKISGGLSNRFLFALIVPDSC